VHEPRGGALMCAVLPLEPCDENADVSVVIMEQDEYPPDVWALHDRHGDDACRAWLWLSSESSVTES